MSNFQMIRWTLVLAVLLAGPQPGAAQAGTSGGQFVQAGPALVPGAGLQAGYVEPYNFYTLEGIFYADGAPSFGGSESTLRVSGGLGASIRPLGVVRTIGNADYGYDVDLGLRFGPSLFFTTDATRSDKNQQFSLFVDLFVRFATRLHSGRIVFFEIGSQEPVFRGGLWFSL